MQKKKNKKPPCNTATGDTPPSEEMKSHIRHYVMPYPDFTYTLISGDALRLAYLKIKTLQA